MRYQIQGTDRETGKKKLNIVVDAESERDAAKQASEKGVLVEKVYPALFTNSLPDGSSVEAKPPPQRVIITELDLSTGTWVGLLIFAAVVAIVFSCVSGLVTSVMPAFLSGLSGVQ